MMDQSVDDKYDGCREKMTKKIKLEDFPREMKNNLLFKNAWKKTQTLANQKYKLRKIPALTKDQIHALYVYTIETPKVYEPFNEAVRSSAAVYNTNAFNYHALHFWLTTALNTINPKRLCRTTYRRCKTKFTGVIGQPMRFGSFTSTSKKTNLIQFGIETCFQIKTCFGAPIQDYSALSSEEEVLVPPYEKFRIDHIARDSYGALNNCKNIFVLESVGYKSNLNCKAAEYKKGWKASSK
ncbi:hypothetical protein WMY93_014876 [Mugilogobius chulae]|uniref:NAD(P)(+)--arginine ADP-ribosyltransferase n=1 Tax=Mugilogobius chulae TaxID=88201 RepID=A0AAW0P2V0_9GOBI